MQFLSHSSISNTNKAIRFKLNIGEPGDIYEREADATADKIMRMNERDSILMQPMEEEEEMLQMAYNNCHDNFFIQNQPLEEEEELLQTKSMHPFSRNEDSQAIQNQISNSKGYGRPMESGTLQFMNSRFGSDFSNVRIHDDSRAHALNNQLNSRAFAIGNNIYFNRGYYNTGNFAGKQLLAHELTHVVQQGATVTPRVQRNGEETESRESSPGGGSNPVARALAGLLRNQLSDSGMRGHLSSLGTALQGLATESTTSEGDQPVSSAERLAALGIPAAFENTARAIISSPTFRQLRQRIVGIVGSSDEAALITALAAAIALVLADIPVSASPSGNIGAGFSAGGSFDLGTIRSLQFRNLSAYVQYANSYFRTRLSGTVSRDQETGDFTGSGTGQIRLGNDLSGLTGSVRVDHEGQVTLVGRLASGYSFGGSDRLIFSTQIEHSFAGDETIITPGLSGRFSFGPDQSLRLGSELQFTRGSGLTGVTGFLEYRHDQVRLRIEGSMTGLGESTGIVPGGDMRLQGVLTIPLW